MTTSLHPEQQRIIDASLAQPFRFEQGASLHVGILGMIGRPTGAHDEAPFVSGTWHDGRSQCELDLSELQAPDEDTLSPTLWFEADRAALDTMVDDAEAAVGPIDILIANAGGPPPGTFSSTEVDAYHDALDLNLMPTVAMCKRLVPGMQERGFGRVLAITSLAVREPIDVLILSNTARAGLTAFLKTMATEVAADWVTVNTLQPGVHETVRLTSIYDDLDAVAAQVPAGRLGDANDFGRIAAFMCSTSASFITGASIPIDGGAARGLQ